MGDKENLSSGAEPLSTKKSSGNIYDQVFYNPDSAKELLNGADTADMGGMERSGERNHSVIRAEETVKSSEMIQLTNVPLVRSFHVKAGQTYNAVGHISYESEADRIVNACLATVRFYDANGKVLAWPYPGLGQSTRVGAYGYLASCNSEEAAILLRFKAPDKAKDVELGFRRWTAKQPVYISAEINLFVEKNEGNTRKGKTETFIAGKRADEVSAGKPVLNKPAPAHIPLGDGNTEFWQKNRSLSQAAAVHEAEKRIIRLETELEAIRNRFHETRLECKAATERVNQLQQCVSREESQRRNVEIQLDKAVKHSDIAEKALGLSKEENAVLRKDIADIEAQNRELTKTAYEAEKQVIRQESEFKANASRIAGLETQHDEIQKKWKAAEELHNSEKNELLNRLNIMRDSVQAQTQHHIRQLESYQSTMAGLEEKIIAARNTYSYKLGYLLTHCTKPLSNLLKLPGAIHSLYKENKVRRKATGQIADIKPDAKSFEKVLEAYNQGKLPAVKERINTLNLKPHRQADLYSALARHLQSYNQVDAAEAARSAYGLDPQPSRAKWLAFHLYDSGAIAEPKRLLDGLPKTLHMSFSEIKRAEEIRSFARLCQTKPALDERRALVYEPLANSLLYVAAASLPYSKTKYANRTQELLNAIVRSGIHVKVMTRPGYPWDLSGIKEKPSGNVTEVEGIKYIHAAHPSQDLPIDIYLTEAANTIEKLAKEQRVCAIQATSTYENAFPALMAARRLGIPFHYEIRGLGDLTSETRDSYYDNAERFKLRLDFEALVANNSDMVYSMSHKLTDYIKRELGVPATAIKGLPKSENLDDIAALIKLNLDVATNATNCKYDSRTKEDSGKRSGNLPSVGYTDEYSNPACKTALGSTGVIPSAPTNMMSFSLENAMKKELNARVTESPLSAGSGGGSAAGLFSLFWSEMEMMRVSEAYNVYREIENFFKINNATPDEVRELKKIQRERVYRLKLLEMADLRYGESIETEPGRICYILHNSLPFSSGGYATRAQGIASGLKASGYDVILMTRPGYPLDMKPELLEADIVTESLIDDLRYVRTLRPLKRGSKCKKGGLDSDSYVMAAADSLEQQFRRLKPSLVMAASNYLTSLPSLIAARRLCIPFVYEVRGFWEITTLSRTPEYAQTIYFMVERLMEAGVAERADHVFTLTVPMKEELIQRGVKAEKIDLLPNSCDVSCFNATKRDATLAAKYGIPDNVPVIGYIGSFVDYEGLEDLARACGQLKRQNIEFRLMLVGNENVSGQDRGPISKQIMETASDKGFADWLIMPGRVPFEQVEGHYSLVDIAPFPRKPWLVCEMVSPIKPLEAMSMQKAVLVSSVRALSEMVRPEETGLIFEKDNVADLTEKLKRLVYDAELRHKLGRNGREWVTQNRTWVLTGRKASEIIQTKVLTAGRHDDKESGEKTDAEEIVGFRELIAEAKLCGKAEKLEPASQNKSVYFLHSSLPYLTGGYATRSHGIIKGVIAAGFNVTPYTRPAFPNDLSDEFMKEVFPDFDEIDSVRYNRIAASFNRLHNTESEYMRAAVDSFVNILRKERPALVHGRSTFLISLPALIAARRVGLPFLYEVSGLWEMVYEGRNQKGVHTKMINRMRALETLVINEADGLITLTDDMREELIKRGAAPDHITIAPNSADPEAFTPVEMDMKLRAKLKIPSDSFVVGYIGTLVDYEGLDDLIWACHTLIKGGVNLRLLMIGKMGQPKLKDLVNELGLQNHVKIPGRVPFHEVKRYYSIMDAVVYPRKPWEVCETVSPMKPFEALCMEKAVLVSSVKALTNIIQDGVTGSVFEKGNIASLTAKLDILLRSPEMRRRLGKAGRQWVKEYRSWNAAGKNVVDAYAMAIRNHKAGTGI
jgi:glycosyltransferase involved in cell wall biosynthesis